MDLPLPLISGAVASAVTAFVLARMWAHLPALAALRRALVMTVAWVVGYGTPALILGPDPSVLGDYRPIAIVATLALMIAVVMVGRRRARAKTPTAIATS